MEPLDDLVVIELGHALAGPFAATLLADFGAQVIKIEVPGVGDSQRRMGPHVEGASLWWSMTGRNKQSIAIDLKAADGAHLVRKLVGGAHVLIENFRPGVVDRLGFGWDDVHALNPGLVMLSISGYGQTGPYSSRGGFGKVAEAFSGATNLTGQRNAAPVHPGYSLADVTSGLMGAYGVLTALRARERTGRGQHIDLALYEPLFRMIEWQVSIRDQGGVNTTRNGNYFPFDGAFYTDIVESSDGQYIVVSAATTDTLTRLQTLVEKKTGVQTSSLSDQTALATACRGWLLTQCASDAIATLHDAGLVAGPISTPEDLLLDPHIQARGNIVKVKHPVIGEVLMPSVLPSLSETPGSIRWVGPALGEHTRAVLEERLGLAPADVDDLAQRGVVGGTEWT